MKLRTDVLIRHDGKRVLCSGMGEMFGPDEVSGEPGLLHDAAAAHALMQMLDDCTGSIISPYAAQKMKDRAAGILASWGFADKVTP